LTITRIDLEDLARKIRFTEKHADYLLITQDVIAAIEETSKAKIDDVKKLNKTIEALLHGPLKEHIPTKSKPAKIVAIIHATRGIDSMILRLIRKQTKKNTIYRSANCNSNLARVLREHGVHITDNT